MEERRIEEILEEHPQGYRQYIIEDGVQLYSVNQTLCRLLQTEKVKMLQQNVDGYAAFVHPLDQEGYGTFFRRIIEEEGEGALEYHLLLETGEVLFVRDIGKVRERKDGVKIADFFLTDLTTLRQEKEGLPCLEENLPFGFLKYTCDMPPKITYMNRKMLDFLGFPENLEERKEELKLYQSNIFLMIPMEERGKLAKYLEQVYQRGEPLAGEVSILRLDGTKGHFFGWVTKESREGGIEEYQSVCLDITQQREAQKEAEVSRYLNALTEVYEKIFEYHRKEEKVTCLYSNPSSKMKWLEGVSMEMREATRKWIEDTIILEDKSRVEDFFEEFFDGQAQREERPMQITYQAKNGEGEFASYQGIFLKMREDVYLYCSRKLVQEASLEGEQHRESFREDVKDLMLQFTDGIAAFEILGEGLVTPLYSSENVCAFFGYTKEEWEELRGKETPLEEFVKYRRERYEELLELFHRGEREFIYQDAETKQLHRTRAVCSQKSLGGRGSRYVILYKVEEEACQDSPVFIRTFGYFDVFVDGTPIPFRHKKSKELLALLVDRKGGYVSSEEAIGFLWEEEPIHSLTLARYRKVALRLKNTLEAYGISDIVESVDGKRRIVTSKVRCDLYDYLSKEEVYQSLFKGNYLTNYSWGETTLGELTRWEA